MLVFVCSNDIINTSDYIVLMWINTSPTFFRVKSNEIKLACHLIELEKYGCQVGYNTIYQRNLDPELSSFLYS